MVCLSEKNTEGLSKSSADLKAMIDSASFSSGVKDPCLDDKYNKFCKALKFGAVKRNVIQKMIIKNVIQPGDLLFPPFSPTAKEFLNLGGSGSGSESRSASESRSGSKKPKDNDAFIKELKTKTGSISRTSQVEFNQGKVESNAKLNTLLGKISSEKA